MAPLVQPSDRSESTTCCSACRRARLGARPTPHARSPARGKALSTRLSGRINSGAVNRNQAIAEFLKEHGSDDWIGTQFGRFLSQFDTPKSLDDLISAEKNDNPRKKLGYETHHVVEVHRDSDDPLANSNNFSDEELESDQNKVRIPYYKHQQITSFYRAPNKDYGGLTPREYLRGKSWDEQYETGLKVMRRFGVLK